MKRKLTFYGVMMLLALFGISFANWNVPIGTSRDITQEFCRNDLVGLAENPAVSFVANLTNVTQINGTSGANVRFYRNNDTSSAQFFDIDSIVTDQASYWVRTGNVTDCVNLTMAIATDKTQNYADALNTWRSANAVGAWHMSGGDSTLVDSSDYNNLTRMGATQGSCFMQDSTLFGRALNKSTTGQDCYYEKTSGVVGLPTGTGGSTELIWVWNELDTGDNRFVWGYGANAGGALRQVSVYDSPTAYYYDDGSTALSSGATLGSGAWDMIKSKFGGTTAYLKKNEEAFATGTFGSTNTYLDSIRLLNRIDGNYNGLRGLVTELRIYNETKSDDFIKFEYNQNVTILADEIATYANNLAINCSNVEAGTPIVINGSSGFEINGQKQIVWTNCQSLPIGGNVTTDGLYTIHTFNANGTFTVPKGIIAEVLIVGGGGSGRGTDDTSGGGGDAGQLVYNAANSIAAGTYSVVIGAGGAGSTTIGNAGEPSSFNSLTATGGAGSTNGNGMACSNIYGGAGAGAAGVAGVSSYGGYGGVGLNYTISGANIYYAGGGGGGCSNGGLGGNGGGGAGSNFDVNNGAAGVGGLGAGGGGRSAGTSQPSYAGGSGVVIVRYLTADAQSPPLLKYNNETDYIVEWNGIQQPMEVELGTGTNFNPTRVWRNAGVIAAFNCNSTTGNNTAIDSAGYVNATAFNLDADFTTNGYFGRGCSMADSNFRTDPSPIYPSGASNPFTITMWANLTTLQDKAIYEIKGSGSIWYAAAFSNDANYYKRVNNGVTDTNDGIATPAGSWALLSWGRSAATTYPTQINTTVGAIAGVGSANIAADSKIAFGDSPNVFGRGITGILDNILLWNTTLSSNTLTQLYYNALDIQGFGNLEAGPTPPPSGCTNITTSTTLIANETNCVNIAAGGSLDCAGFSIVGNGSGTGLMIAEPGTTVANCGFKGWTTDIHVLGVAGITLENVTGGTDYGLIVDNTNDSTFSNLNFQNISSIGIWVVNDSNNNNFTTIDIATPNIGISIDSGVNNTFDCTAGIINSTGGAGFSVSTGTTTVKNCIIPDGGASNRGIWLHSGATNGVYENNTIITMDTPVTLDVGADNNYFVNNTLNDSNGNYAFAIDSTGNTILQNNITSDIGIGGAWIADSADGNFYNDSLIGNIYYYADGTPAWDVWDITALDPILFPWADGGASIPFDSTTLTDGAWVGFGQDWHPYTLNSTSPTCYSLASNYTLNQTAAINGSTCFTVTMPDVTIDCNGYAILGNNTIGTFGVDSDQPNTVVKNCNISGFMTGINLEGNYANATNNTINITLDGGRAITISGGDFAVVDSNIISVYKLGIGFLSGANYGSITNNAIVSTATSSTTSLIDIDTSNYNSIAYNNASGWDDAIRMYNSDNNVVGNNTATSTTDGGIECFAGSDNNVVEYNTINSNGAMYIIGSDNNVYRYNNVTASSQPIVFVGGASTGNSFIGNTLNTLGGYGANIGSAGANTFFFNNTFIGSDPHLLIGGSTGTVVCLNNFTGSPALYVQDSSGSSWYNCSYGGNQQGNIYANVMDNTVNISGYIGSSIAGLYIGSGGPDYPYNSTTSGNKVSGVTDNYPLTPTLDTPPSMITSTITDFDVYLGQTINGSCKASDPETTSLMIYWKLYHDGSIATTGSIPALNNTDTAIATGYIGTSGSWTLGCAVYDGTYYSAELNSTTLSKQECIALNQTATYTLDHNIATSEGCFNITASDVTLDCDGYTITGNNTGYGIKTFTGSNILNCEVHDFASDIIVNGNGNEIQANIFGSPIGMTLNSSGNLVFNNSINADTGILFIGSGTNNTILYNAIQSTYWINDTVNGNYFNNSSVGNIYFLANGTAAWESYSIFATSGYWADSGSDWPFNATTIPTQWIGYGTDFHPYTERGMLPTVAALFPATGSTILTNGDVVRFTYNMSPAAASNCTIYLNNIAVDTQIISSTAFVNVDIGGVAALNTWKVNCKILTNGNITSSTNVFRLSGGTYNTSTILGSSNGNLVDPTGYYYKADGAKGTFYYQTDSGTPLVHFVPVLASLSDYSYATNVSDGFASILRFAAYDGLLAFENGNAHVYTPANQTTTLIGYNVIGNSRYSIYDYAYTSQFPSLALDINSYYLLSTGTKTVRVDGIYTATPTFSTIVNGTHPAAWQTIATDSSLHNWYFAEEFSSSCGGSEQKIRLKTYNGNSTTVIATPDNSCYNTAELLGSKVNFEYYGGVYYMLQTNTTDSVIYNINTDKKYTFSSTQIEQTSPVFFFDNSSFVFFGTEGSSTYAYSCYFDSTPACQKTTIANYAIPAQRMSNSLTSAYRDASGQRMSAGVIVGQTPTLYSTTDATVDMGFVCHDETNFDVAPFNFRVYSNTSAILMPTGATVLNYEFDSARIGASPYNVYTLCTSGTSRQRFLSGSAPMNTRVYTLDQSVGKYITITTVDCNNGVLNGVTISAQRFMAALNAYDTVEETLTQGAGTGTLFLQPSVPYKIEITQPGVGTSSTIYTAGVTDTNVTLALSCSTSGVTAFSQPYANVYSDLTAYVDPPQGTINLVTNNPIFNATFIALSRHGWILNSTYAIYFTPTGTANTDGQTSLVWSTTSTRPGGENFSFPINATQPGTYDLVETLIMLKQNDTLSANSTNLVTYTARGTVSVVPYNSQFQLVSDTLGSGYAFGGWAWILIATVITMLVVGYVSRYTVDGAGFMGFMVFAMFAALNNAALTIPGFGVLHMWNIAAITGASVMAVIIWRHV